MGALVLMATYAAVAILFLIVVGFVGQGVETWAPKASTLVFLAGLAAALGGAWPLAVFLTRGWDLKV